MPVLMKVKGAVSDNNQTVEGLFALQNQLKGADVYLRT
jgi:hypothetical protein